jgi:hypothetical protein
MSERLHWAVLLRRLNEFERRWGWAVYGLLAVGAVLRDDAVFAAALGVLAGMQMQKALRRNRQP